MIVKPAAAPTTNFQAMQNTAQEAQAAALKMLETSKIDNTLAPVEAGDAPEEKKVEAKPEGEPEPENGGEPEEKVEAKPEEKKPEPKKEEGLPDPLKKSFDRLAIEKKELRDMQAVVKADAAKLAKYQLLDRAVENGDALGALAALGMNYSQVVKQLTGGKAPEQPAEPEAQDENPLLSRINALESHIRKESFARGGEKLLSKMQETVKAAAEKYPNVSADPALVEEAREYLYEFTRKTGSPPGEDINESMQMALEAIEVRETALAEKWRKRLGLTSPKPAADTGGAGPKSAVEQPASELGSRSRTLTNSHASSPQAAGSTRPETPDELRAKALKLLEAQG